MSEDYQTNNLQFFVAGIPKPGGSKKYIGHTKPKPGQKARPILIDDAGKGNKEWRKAVADTARVVMAGKPLMTGPIRFYFNFQMPRPKYHFNRRGELNASAPRWPTVKPDTTKLIRSTEDALTGIVWTDDAQVCDQSARKEYTNNNSPGCTITITRLER